MRRITKKQEEAQLEQQRQDTEKKLRLMGHIIADEMLICVGWKDETIPDIGAYIRQMASEISYADL